MHSIISINSCVHHFGTDTIKKKKSYNLFGIFGTIVFGIKILKLKNNMSTLCSKFIKICLKIIFTLIK